MNTERYVSDANRMLCIEFAKECLASAKKFREKNMLRPAAICLKHARVWRLKAARTFY